jgi:outer membrane protein OmpA-like peptidoglycan-associated protein
MRPILFLCSTALIGCAAANNSQLTTCQAEKEQLLATIRNQRDANRTLTEQVASLESRLDQAEKAIAQGSSPPRFSKTPDPPREVTKTASLSWRDPQAPDAAPGHAALQTLAAQDSRVKYNSHKRLAQIELPLTFREGSAALSGEDKAQLDEMARLLRSDAARDLEIVVAAGDSQRAKAVADYLDRHGIPRDRLSVSQSSPRSGTSPVQLQLRASEHGIAGRTIDNAPRR